MKSARSQRFFNKTILSGAITAALSIGVGLGVTTAQADIYEFTFDNSGCSAGPPPVACGGTGDAIFSILNSSGAPTQNNSYPYYGDATWGYGVRTQIGGSITIKETVGAVQGKGVVTIDPFDFFDAGAAIAHDITLADVGDGVGGAGTLWLGQMLFDWNNNNGIPVSLVWDLEGLLGGLSGLDINNIADPANVIANVGAVPGSGDGLKNGQFPIGASPVATTAFDTTPLCDPDDSNPDAGVPDCALGLNPSGGLPLIPDAATNPGTASTGSLGIGGSPMITAPFKDFNANFDITKLTLSGYNDTTAPAVTLGVATVTVSLGGAFDPNDPGVSVTCADNADGSDDIIDSAATNPDISFTVAGDVVDVNTEGNYLVTYTCTDNASARAAIASDPEASGNATVPADNTSAVETLTVTVGDVDRPTITVLGDNPLTHQACTTYADPGATAVDAAPGQDGDITGSIVVTDNNTIIGNSPNESTATIDYDVRDSGTGNPGGIPLDALTQTRTVNIIDTLAPVLTIAAGFSVESSDCPTFNANLPVATVGDSCNQGATTAVTSNTVTCVVPDGQDTQESTLLYSADDLANTPNTGKTSTVVTVSRSEPVITMIGSASIVLNVGDTYIEEGMDIHDVQDGNLTAVTTSGTTPGVGAGAGNLTHNIVIRDVTSTIVPSLDTSVNGSSYTVSYDVTDSDSNTATQVTRDVSVGVFADNSNFTMLNAAGKTFGGTNDVVFDWDETLNTLATDTNFNMGIFTATPTDFEGAVWIAHDIRAFGPGTYYFETDNSVCTVAVLKATGCPGTAGSPTSMEMIVGPDQIGAHILFDWNGVLNIDVVNVWDQNAVWDDFGDAAPRNTLFLGPGGTPPDATLPWELVSTSQSSDVNGPVHGSPMIDGPFIGFYANFNAGPGGVGEGLAPITSEAPDTSLGASSMSVWAILTGLFSLIGLRIACRKTAGKS